jgi:hypothetical protein
MPVAQPSQPGVRGAEAGAGVAIRAAQGHGKESSLFRDLTVHIGGFKIRREQRIRQDFPVESLGRRSDGRSAA